MGETYSDDLDQLLERLTRSSIGRLQFANAIVSVSLGFFTHSASQTPDERYLEVILGMPDILDNEADLTQLVTQLFSQYGGELLSILTEDQTISNDTKIAGYGLHFSWRSLKKTPSGPHLTLRESVVYLDKEQSRQFLGQRLTQDDLLRGAVLFIREGDQPARQIFYIPPERQLPVRLLPLDDTTATTFDGGQLGTTAEKPFNQIENGPEGSAVASPHVLQSR